MPMKLNRRKSILALLLAPFGFKAAVNASTIPQKEGFTAIYSGSPVNQYDPLFNAMEYRGTWRWVELTDPNTYPKGAGDIRTIIV